MALSPRRLKRYTREERPHRFTPRGQSASMKIRFALGARAKRVAQAGAQVNLNLESGGRESSVSGSHLLLAVGWRPNTDDLGIEKAGIAIDSHGFIQVNDRLETVGLDNSLDLDGGRDDRVVRRARVRGARRCASR